MVWLTEGRLAGSLGRRRRMGYVYFWGGGREGGRGEGRKGGKGVIFVVMFACFFFFSVFL